MSIVTRQVWEHSFVTEVTRKTQNESQWITRYLYTETSQPRSTLLCEQYITRKAYDPTGTITVTNATGGTDLATAATILFNGGVNEGDQWVVDMTVAADGRSGPVQIDYTVQSHTTPYQMLSQWLVQNSVNYPTLSFEITQDATEGEWLCTLSIFADPAALGESVTVDLLTHTPATITVPPNPSSA